MLRRTALLGLGALAARPALAAYPERLVTMVTGYSPGGSTDILARLLTDPLAGQFGAGTRIAVENRPGASGVVASDWLRRQPADGYLMMVAETGSHGIAPNALVGGTRYNPVEDFTHLGVLGAPPLVLIVTNAFPGRSAAEIVERLRSSPLDSLTYATSGVGGVLHLASEMLAQHLGTRFVHVPYRSGAQMLQSIHTGEAQFGIAAIASAAAQMRDGLVRPVAVTGLRRSAAFPDIPTLAENGVPGFEFDSWYVMVGPAGIPVPVAETINGALRTCLAQPELRQKLLGAGHEAWDRPNSLEDARSFMAREVAKYRDIVARTGIRLSP